MAVLTETGFSLKPLKIMNYQIETETYQLYRLVLFDNEAE